MKRHYLDNLQNINMEKEKKHNAYAINRLIDIVYEDVYFSSSFNFTKSIQAKAEYHFNKWMREMIMPNFKILDIFNENEFVKLIEKLHRENYDNGLLGKANYLRKTEEILVKWEISVMGNNNTQNKLFVNEYENKFMVNHTESL